MEGNVELGRTHAKKWRTRWKYFRDEMSMLTELEIPRYIFMDQNSKNIQLHGFCEASSVAYSAVCYLKSGTIEGQVKNAQYALDRTTPPGRAIRPNTHVRDRYEQHPRTPEPTLGQGERTNGNAQIRTPNVKDDRMD
ncbi:hypothetical protein LAZ67_23001452 [Cordylochernes scorpioides]|uniref:Uncharacterized protein n=1 Tax=Cordylochernes scorpioides TaxID=51811 RepID=A0ABY6LUZ5_9ARAC|nr:hypothetical protein LAZ67_23001452 [Cordylochernes scorpioides]